MIGRIQIRKYRKKRQDLLKVTRDREPLRDITAQVLNGHGS